MNPNFTRPTKINAVKLRISHGGSLFHYPCKLYVDRKIYELNSKWDVDSISYMEIFKVTKSLGYVRVKFMWYHDSKFSLEHGRIPINNDKDILKFREDMKGYDYVNIYVEHIVDELNVVIEDGVREYIKARQDTINIDSNDEVHLEDKDEDHLEETEEVQDEQREEFQSEEDEDFVQDDNDDLYDSEFNEIDEYDLDWTQ
ncbi:hypothetical protein KIW84_045278 [Lathyrus oleraceus]|uniref:PB1-like domain-containing protein n=1 Tax=Pisum sativum TaxID=3888 RepID=A0A9D4XMW7_PEA|nr:hypothetical protein KIW84_045278 [Pisum sativum]